MADQQEGVLAIGVIPRAPEVIIIGKVEYAPVLAVPRLGAATWWFRLQRPEEGGAWQFYHYIGYGEIGEANGQLRPALLNWWPALAHPPEFESKEGPCMGCLRDFHG